MCSTYAALSELTSFTVQLDAVVGRLDLAAQAEVDVLRALARWAVLIVVDEPTAALDGAESARLVRTIRTLADGGTTVVLVTHCLDDVLAVSDDVTVLRDGAVVRSGPAAAETTGSLVQAMLGSAVAAATAAPPPPSAAAPSGPRPARVGPGAGGSLRRRLARGAPRAGAQLVRAGGQRPLRGAARGVRGRPAHRRHDRGARADGERAQPPRRRAAGHAMPPESRELQGLHLTHTLARIVSRPHLRTPARAGALPRGAERSLASAVLARLGLQPKSVTLWCSRPFRYTPHTTYITRWEDRLIFDVGWPDPRPDPRVRGTLREDAASYIRQQILLGKLRPGNRIDQDALAAELGVSRLPVRESLIQLATEGLVEEIPRRGAFVAALTREDIEDHYRIFGSLEALAATRAAKKISEDDLDRLDVIVAETIQLSGEDEQRAEELHFEFHRVINRAGASQRLNAALRAAAKGIPGKIYQTQRGHSRQATDEHRRILTFLRKRDSAGAAEATRQHLETGAQAVIANMERSGFWA